MERFAVEPRAAEILFAPLTGRKNSRGFLARENAGAFAKVEPLAHFRNTVHAEFQTLVNEIGVARFNQCPAKIEIARTG